MRIEALRAPTVRGGRYLATLDTGRKLRLEAPVVAAFGLFAGRELEEAEFLRLQAENRKASAKARAVRMVAASAVSHGELERRLVAKGEDREDARAAVAWLTELDLLDDRKTARQLAEAAARKGYGPARIRQVLYQKGIDRSLWEEAMADLPAPDGAIDRFLASRFRGGTPDEREIRRAAEALVRRGHRWGDIRAALSRYTDALDGQFDDIEEE